MKNNLLNILTLAFLFLCPTLVLAQTPNPNILGGNVSPAPLNYPTQPSDNIEFTFQVVNVGGNVNHPGLTIVLSLSNLQFQGGNVFQPSYITQTVSLTNLTPTTLPFVWTYDASINTLTATLNGWFNMGQGATFRIGHLEVKNANNDHTNAHTGANVNVVAPAAINATQGVSDNTSAYTWTVPYTPTPLSLLNFTTQEQSCGVVELKWQTTMEKNLDKFVVEYSKDGKSFAAVKEVKAKNEANGAAYSTTVKQEGKEGFYRLNSIDFDKTNAYSNVSKIVLSCSMDKTITVAPNPATNTLTVATLEGSETIQIMNTIGQKVLEVKAKKGENVVDISQLPAANYNLLIVEEGKTTATFKVVKL